MKLLFDTHTFIWWDSQPNNLSQTALTLLQDRSNILLLSVISIWEMQIKLQLGKLTLCAFIKRSKIGAIAFWKRWKCDRFLGS